MLAGVDIGGTFTDVVAYDPATGRLRVTKVPSTPDDLVDGFLAGLDAVCKDLDVSPGAVTQLGHGTTIATNAILEHRGARLGILTTRGFRDVLVLGRMKRSQMYDLFMDAETPLFLAARRHIHEITERLDADGNVVTPVSAEDVHAAVRDLVDREGVEALVICFLHSYANDSHEQEARRIVGSLYPDLPVSVSSEVDPRFREYERLVVTAFDAYVRPVIRRYVGNLVTDLGAHGVMAPLRLMQSRGGLAGATTVLARPVATVLSGPAAGVISAAYAAASAGMPNAISIDVGGTSADVALIVDGKPSMTTEAKIDRYPLRLPAIDVRTVGAGGGSIAWIDAAGGLKVGPQSAGSTPGPAAYGRGGTEATVTDASLVLGYLTPQAFAGGLALDPTLSERAVRERVATPLGMSVPQAALGIQRIINSRMAQALRLVSVEQGHDPRDFVLVALGGAGALHAGRLAEELHIPRVLVPPTPGVLSALGLLLARVEHEFARTMRARLGEIDPDAVGRLFEDLDAACTNRMTEDGVFAGIEVEHFAELRYVGQSYELEVPLPGPVSQESLAAAAEAFHGVHERTYAYSNQGAPVEFVSFRAVHRGPKMASIQAGTPSGEATGKPYEEREAWFSATGPERTAVYRRTDLPSGFATVGPAIVEQPDTTTVVYPGQRLSVDGAGNMILEV